MGHVATGAGPAAIQIMLDVGLGQIHARRAAVDHAANGRAVGFTKVGDCEKVSKGVAAHRTSLSLKLGQQFRVTADQF
jgi:hypothetical protein